MMKQLLFLLLVFVCFLSAEAQTARRKSAPIKTAVKSFVADNPVSELPIRRVILYSNGVAYIERRGMVSGNAEINLSFKQSQVDDVLKSMVVLDLNQGKIGAVSYNSSMPASARTAEIPFSVQSSSGDGGGIAGVLSQLQGAKVSVTTDRGTFTGSILTVERKQVRTAEGNLVSTSMLVIASATGDITSFDLSTVRGVRVLDEETRKDLNEFASATASARRRDAKTITVTSNGTGQREMVVSYTIAAPIWKTTYRVVLDQAGKPFFQGWAIVDNVSEEDWQNVRLSLVSGSPVSFIQNLQKPFYRYRPVIATPQDLQLRPQVHEPGGVSSNRISGTVTDANGAVVPGAAITIRNDSTGETASAHTDGSGNFSRTGLGAGMYSVTVSAPNFKETRVERVQLGTNLQIPVEPGNISETVVITSGAEILQTETATVGSTVLGRQIVETPVQSRDAMALVSMMPGVSSVGIAEAVSSSRTGLGGAALGEDIGDLFQYTIEHPITVMRDRSALIPIIQTKMDGERVAVYNESVRQDRPYSGVLLKNGSGLTFESGSMTILDGDAYAGEALMERLKPKEERLISFALDLGTNVRVRQDAVRGGTRVIKIVNGTFQAHYFQTEAKTYHFSNLSDRKKVVYVEHPIRSGWVLADEGQKPDYTTQRYYRFRVELEPFKETELTVSERQPLVDSYRLEALSRDNLDMFVARNYIDGDLRTRLERLLELRATIYRTGEQLQSFNLEVTNISNDQRRLRENIEALAKTPEAKTLITRYISKANEQESRLEQIEKDRKTVSAERERLERELATEILKFDVR
ncbi:MAG TPA: carboxypeptidase regulatory-like domain-containing protein [Pyrinomonadaceae bacterium]|nr:carboxypeptidase regulatory-like domain-containing protein [Pyrinomonadaceae bacterium]